MYATGNRVSDAALALYGGRFCCFGKIIHLRVIICWIHASHGPIFLTLDPNIQFPTSTSMQTASRYLELHRSEPAPLLYPPLSPSQLMAPSLARCSGEENCRDLWSLSFLPNTIRSFGESCWLCIQVHSPTKSHIFIQVTSHYLFPESLKQPRYWACSAPQSFTTNPSNGWARSFHSGAEDPAMVHSHKDKPRISRLPGPTRSGPVPFPPWPSLSSSPKAGPATGTGSQGHTRTLSPEVSALAASEAASPPPFFPVRAQMCT